MAHIPRFDSRNPHEALGVHRNATMDVIKRAYRTLARRYHPDKNPDHRADECKMNFQKIDAAYKSLAHRGRCPAEQEPQTECETDEEYDEGDEEQFDDDPYFEDFDFDYDFYDGGSYFDHFFGADFSGSSYRRSSNPSYTFTGNPGPQNAAPDFNNLQLKLIFEVTPGRPKIRICAQVVKRDKLPFRNGQGQRLQLHLEDETGKIVALAWNDFADTFAPQISIHKTYHFAGFKVKDKHPIWNKLEHNYELKFDGQTAVTPCNCEHV